ncbi:hypothetical protein [Flavobacterium collinsii]|jgi:hypothetical protein|uniref:Lipoprotein n=1 Tax=Flavobacterium collinsii TaxID=1114861 RepID=A0A9W4TIN6_9FLAO|nr:hypothetical protein [Flavobacterium collinsii]CAA9199664.1 hypothetical protein FLACOL7796_02864 [Flavobacterium collinsii]CAI2767494.1 conserved protein of unknown function [Flavobacterium collinsii]
MKKIFLFAVVMGLSFSCGKKVAEENKTPEKKEEVRPVVVGGDSDAHGCKGSAGYTWSVLKNECVRIFEIGTKLAHAEDGKTYSTVAYVIFDGNKAELFLDTQDEVILLERKSEGEPWVKGDYQLIAWKGYVLKKNGKIIYTGE